MFERKRVPALGRAMAEKKMIEQARMNPLRGRGRRRRDKAVDDNRDLRGGSCYAYPRHRRDFETAERSQNRLARRERRAMNFERAHDHFGLAADARIVESG